MKYGITHAGFLLGMILSIIIIYFSFDYASTWRMQQGIFFGIGAEWLTVLLPITLYVWRIKSINKEEE